MSFTLWSLTAVAIAIYSLWLVSAAPASRRCVHLTVSGIADDFRFAGPFSDACHPGLHEERFVHAALIPISSRHQGEQFRTIHSSPHGWPRGRQWSDPHVRESGLSRPVGQVFGRKPPPVVAH